MTTQELNKEARELAQKLVDLEINRKDIMTEMSELKENFEQLVEDGADSSIDVNGGLVYIAETISYSVSDGLLEEIELKVRDITKISQELISTYFNKYLKLTKRGLKEIKNSENLDLSKLIVQKEKSSVKIKI